jgi:hypothetical protein
VLLSFFFFSRTGAKTQSFNFETLQLNKISSEKLLGNDGEVEPFAFCLLPFAFQQNVI